MKTLKQAAIGDTVKVVKLHGEGAGKTQNYGYGYHKRCEVHIVRLHRLVIRLRSQ